MVEVVQAVTMEVAERAAAEGEAAMAVVVNVVVAMAVLTVGEDWAPPPPAPLSSPLSPCLRPVTLPVSRGHLRHMTSHMTSQTLPRRSQLPPSPALPFQWRRWAPCSRRRRARALLARLLGRTPQCRFLSALGWYSGKNKLLLHPSSRRQRHQHPLQRCLQLASWRQCQQPPLRQCTQLHHHWNNLFDLVRWQGPRWS